MARIIKGSKPDYIKNLKPIHRLMAMKTACFGYRPVQLSGAFGYSLRQVTRITNSDPFCAYRVRPDENGRRRASGRDDKR
ncbi:MAG: hypothetical protein V1244_01925 [Nitrospinaceae bacterium]|jgi:hypothetical protein|nr:hypothetical protein [Nitrospinaceae bacterium]HJO61884.1 hypothetical protein [Desulfobacterales bacterium]